MFGIPILLKVRRVFSRRAALSDDTVGQHCHPSLSGTEHDGR
jgi:hypothetical protein